MDDQEKALHRPRQVGARAARPVRSALQTAAAALVLAGLAACGGSKGEAGSAGPLVETPASRADAARFLTQATFGATEVDLDRVMSIGYRAWLDEQWAKPRSQHGAFWDEQEAQVKAGNPSSSIGADGVYNAFWKAAVSGEDQLRQRVAFALSQIFVISLQDGAVDDSPRAVADYLDLLAVQGTGSYRELLEAVSRHPMMGLYLSHLRNQKANARTGRVPDENYAREVMQLFSIGLHGLNADGSVKTQGGQPVETYTPSDISGLARVFTGFSWACPAWPDNACFSRGEADGESYADRALRPMVGYPQYHSTEEKTFLGKTIPVQAQADPDASLAAALDHLAGHPNVGPFIGRQLIQRLVTSNPSPAYVAAVSAAFADNGQGVRGDMKAVVKAVLLHPEARASSNTAGKLREPVLKLSALLRAFGFSSDSGRYRVGNTDSAATALGQTPMRSPSVFNFWRPGYVAPGTAMAAQGLVAPEMQQVNETSVAGYVNYMRDAIASGVGATGTATVDGATVTRRDLQADLGAELALAGEPEALVERVNQRLLLGAMPADLKSEIVAAVSAISLPALNATGSNQNQINTAKRNRVNAAIFLTVVSPEYRVQK
jgi:uncharacterized protein (DUF1800 family)